MLTDSEIEQLIKTPKIVRNPRARSKEQRKSVHVTYMLESECGTHRFDLYTRQNQIDPEHYSCGLVYHHPDSGGIPLLRYNGSNHEHRNPLEDNELIRFRCHIHRATQRYIELGDKAEKYAETTDRYSNMGEALACLLLDCSVSGLHTPQPASRDDWSQMSFLHDN